MGKETNEITVRIKGTIEEVEKILNKNNFKIVDEFSLDDTFFIPKKLDWKKLSIREIISKAVIARVVKRKERIVQTLTIKKKEFDENGNIIKQEKSEIDVLNIEDAKKFMKVLEYEQLMNIKEKDITYEKNGFRVSLKNIKNGEKLIESDFIFDNDELNTAEKLVKKFEEYEIPIFTDDLFVKKAEIELKKVLEKIEND